MSSRVVRGEAEADAMVERPRRWLVGNVEEWPLWWAWSLFRSGLFLERGGGFLYRSTYCFSDLHIGPHFCTSGARRTCVFYNFFFVPKTLTDVAGLSSLVNCDAFVAVLVLLVCCFIPLSWFF